jgi:hypothetical protein
MLSAEHVEGGAEMSDEQREDEIEVEGHAVEPSVQEEPADEGNDEIEAHVLRTANVRMDSPSNS